MTRVDLVKIDEWRVYPWLRHGFTTRVGGVSTVYGSKELNLGFTKEDDAAAVARNRELVVEGMGGGGPLVMVRQVHGVEVLVAGEGPVVGDGLMTAERGLLLGIMTADCVPVLVADVKKRVVAGFHAGWRGTAGGIVELGIARMRKEFGCDVADLVAAVGPSIGVCCYKVGEELREVFAGDLFRGDSLDLWEANRRQLVGAGVTRVSVVGECTACARVEGRRKYFSHRAEDGFTGRQIGVIGVV